MLSGAPHAPHAVEAPHKKAEAFGGYDEGFDHQRRVLGDLLWLGKEMQTER